MLAGQQHLEDAGYGVSSEKQDDDGNEEKDLSLDIEEQLAPWIVTRNFINATQVTPSICFLLSFLLESLHKV
jgi:transcription initiation factor TFIID subunit 1